MDAGYQSIRRTLRNKPLVEAIFEMRWGLQESQAQPGLQVDPHYTLLIGSLYSKLRDKYPFHEQLPTAMMPSDLVAHIVQHRFRAGENQWPLVQVGPGIITLNDTTQYTWENFEQRAFELVDTLFASHPNAKDLKITGVLLRYIDAIPFNYDRDDVFQFLGNQMKTKVELHQDLFEIPGIASVPLSLNLQFAFPSSEPPGVVQLRFGKGTRHDEDALVWETVFQAGVEDSPQSPEDIEEWLRGAHAITGSWFFKIIAGELQERFE